MTVATMVLDDQDRLYIFFETQLDLDYFTREHQCFLRFRQGINPRGNDIHTLLPLGLTQIIHANRRVGQKLQTLHGDVFPAKLASSEAPTVDALLG